MKLLIVRHAIAEDRDLFGAAGKSDHLRPLTRDGKRRMVRASKGLKFLVPKIDTILSSSYTRAAQTADILAKTYPKAELHHQEELEGGSDMLSLLSLAQKYDSNAVVAVVGHEPQLSSFIARFFSEQPRSTVTFKKGAACMIEFTGEVTFGAGELLWLIPPKVRIEL